jgi:tetratricopeptide (TPR) repeat protein
LLTRILIVVPMLVLILAGASSLHARQVDPRTPPPPPPSAEGPPATAPAAPIDPSVPPPPPPAEESLAPAEPVFDPLHAERSLDVGTFYLKKGNYDAAIDRFQEAARYQPKLARPWLLLGETYEKKHDNARAVESYKKYLEVFPGAPDAAKVQKRVAALEEKAGPQASKNSAH